MDTLLLRYRGWGVSPTLLVYYTVHTSCIVSRTVVRRTRECTYARTCVCVHVSPLPKVLTHGTEVTLVLKTPIINSYTESLIRIKKYVLIH